MLPQWQGFLLGFAPLAFGSVKNLYHKAVHGRGVKLPDVWQYMRYWAYHKVLEDVLVITQT